MDKKTPQQKPRVFGRDAIRLIRILFAALVLLCFAVIMSARFTHVISGGRAVILLMVVAAAAAAAALAVRARLIVPYRRCRSLFRKFTRNEVYRDLLSSRDLIFEEQRDVLNHVHSLLDERNMIRLSTKQAELLALQNQINPHFLYNTLEAVRSDALCAGLDSIANTTEALATFFRYTISDVGSLATVEAELDNIENYFSIQKYRFGEKFSMHVAYSPDDDILSLKLPKLTLQPIVENAIFHGLESRAEGGRIDISLEITEQNLYISVRDNGIGIPEDRLAEINDRLAHVSLSGEGEAETSRKKGGIALNNIARRIRLLFGEDYGLHIYSVSGTGTDVRLKVPMIRGTEEGRGTP